MANLGFGLIFGSETKGAEAGIDRLIEKMDHLNSTVSAVGEEMSHTFEHAAGFLVKVGGSLVKISAEVEHSTAELKFAYRDASEADFSNVTEQLSNASLYTTQTQKELTDMAAMMKQVNGIDIFGPQIQAQIDKLPERLRSALKGNSAVLMSEVGLAANTEQSFASGVFAMMEGHWKRAAIMIRPLAQHIDEYKAAMAGATTNTEKWAKIVPLLARDFGSLNEILSHTWEYMAHQVVDVQQKLWSTLGTPMMNRLKGPMAAFLDYFVDPDHGLLVSKNKDKLDGLANAFADIGGWVADAAMYVGELARGIFEFAAAHPYIVKLVGAIAIGVAALTGLAAALASIRLAVMALNFAFGAMEILMSPLVLIVGMLATAGYFLAKMKVGGDGFADTMSRIGEVLAAAWEGLSNINEGMATLSGKTADSLASKGLLGVATNIMMYGYRIKQFFEGLWAGLKETFGEGGFAYGAFQYLAKTVGDLFGDIAKTTGMTADGASDKWASAGFAIGKVIGFIVGAFAYGFALIIKIIDYAVKAVGLLIDAIEWVGEKLKPVIKAFHELKEASDWYNDKGDYAGDVNAGDFTPAGVKAASETGFKNAGQRQNWAVGQTTEMNNRSQMPAIKAVQALLNPDTRDAITKRNDASFQAGDQFNIGGGHTSASPWLQKQQELSQMSPKHAEAMLAEMRKLTQNGMGVYLDGEKVGHMLSKQQVIEAERSGTLGK